MTSDNRKLRLDFARRLIEALIFAGLDDRPTTLARHFKHLRMMQHLLGLMGHSVEFVQPQAQAFMQRRARIMMHKAGLLRSAS